jgi:serine/tyrosine/threonine adenylyltransferase
LPLIEGPPEAASEQLLAALEPYKAEFSAAMVAGLRAKLGLATEHDDDAALADDFLRLMAEDHADFTIAWRRLASIEQARDCFLQRDKFDAWAQRYRDRLALESSDDAERATRMNRVNPKFVLRNHLAQNAIEAAQQGDFSETERLLHVLEHPFDEQPHNEAYAAFPPDWASHLEVSCSS